MNRILRSAVVIASLVFALGGAPSWGQVPATNDTSDTHGNTGGGTGALVNVTPGVPESFTGISNTQGRIVLQEGGLPGLAHPGEDDHRHLRQRLG